MASKVLTFIIDTADQTLDSAMAALINEVHSLGHTVREVRVTDDTGESKVPVNTIAGVNPPDATPPVEEPPATTPEPAPVDPTPDPTPSDPSPSDSTDVPDAPVDVPVDTPPTPTA